MTYGFMHRRHNGLTCVVNAPPACAVPSPSPAPPLRTAAGVLVVRVADASQAVRGRVAGATGHLFRIVCYKKSGHGDKTSD